MLSLFECMTCSLPLPLEEIRLIATVNSIFHLSDFLRLFMSFEYSSTVLRYSSTYSVLSLSPLLLYSI